MLTKQWNVDVKHCVYLHIKNKSILYSQYFDDIFNLWAGTKQEILDFFGKFQKES